jgi:hypothetical protein
MNRFYDDAYSEYRCGIVPEVYYEDDGMYISDGDYISEDEFIAELDANEIYQRIHEIEVSDDALITDLKYYFDNMMFKNNDKWYVYYMCGSVEHDMFLHDVVIRAAVKFVSGFIKISGDSTFKWNNGMIIDENNANFKFKMNPCVHDSAHFRENVMMLYAKIDEENVLGNLYKMVERAIYERRVDDLKWIIDSFPDLLHCIYDFDYMNYLIYYDDMELFEMLLPAAEIHANYDTMIRIASKYNKQPFLELLTHRRHHASSRKLSGRK